MRTRDTRGLTVVEMLISMIVASVLMSSALAVMIQQQRFYLVADDISHTVGDLGLAEMRLQPELLPLSPGAGDIMFAGPDSLKVRVFRGVFSVCDKEVSSDVFVTVRRLTASSVPLTADSAFVYLRGTSNSISDDNWKVVRLTSVKPSVCPDGTPAWRATVPDLNGVAFQLPVGSPLRLFRHGSYWLQLGPQGWFVMTNASSGSPTKVAGPLMPPSASKVATMRFRYLDDEGDKAESVAEIERIDIYTASSGSVAMTRDGDPYHTDRTLSFKLRNE